MAVTPRQRKVYDYLCRYVEAHNEAPTIAEIGTHFGLRSPATVHHLLTALEKAGMIRRIPNAGRGIEIVKTEEPVDKEGEIPLLGVIAAGRPIEAVLSHETIQIPPDMLGRGRTFALRVRGDSMIEDHIRSGDFIVVDSRPTAENGQTVVALVDGHEATVKRFYRDRDHIRLEPANPNYDPIVVPHDRVDIQGIVIGVIRKYQR